MAFPADRFRPAAAASEQGRELLAVKLPGFLAEAVRDPARPGAQIVDLGMSAMVDDADPARGLVREWVSGPVAFDRVVPPSGNLQVAGKQFWLGPARSGLTVTFWADTDVIHLLIAGARIKSVRSHLSVTDLAALARDGGRPAGPSPLPLDAVGPPGVVEVDRTVNRCGSVSLGQHIVLAAEILGGRRVSIRLDAQTLAFFDPQTRELLRTRSNPLTAEAVSRLRGARPAGPPPQPPTGPVRVQRRASNTGIVMVVGQKIALGRAHAGETVTIDVTETDLTVECDDGPRTFQRTNDHPVRRIKAHRPRKVDLNV
jgi:hypothetical protein